MSNKKLITEVVHNTCPCRCHKKLLNEEKKIDHGTTPCCPQVNKTLEEAPIAED